MAIYRVDFGDPPILLRRAARLFSNRSLPLSTAGRHSSVQNAVSVTAPSPSRARLWWEIAIVLALSLGASAVYAIVYLSYLLVKTTPLSQQTATLNSSKSSLEVFDLIYQLLPIIFDLAPVALVAFILWRSSRPHLGRLGITFDRPGRDLGWGAALALIIGIPGLCAYLAAKALNLGVTVVPSSLTDHWWTVPVLLLAAARAAIQEEVIVVGYLYERLGELRWGRWRIILSTAVLRGSYHLYQGFGAFIANTVMGVAFGWLYTKYGRLLPLVVTHFLLDAAVFVGYPWAAAAFPGLFAPPAT
jgi:uncharacterized protein